MCIHFWGIPYICTGMWVRGHKCYYIHYIHSFIRASTLFQTLLSYIPGSGLRRGSLLCGASGQSSVWHPLEGGRNGTAVCAPWGPGSEGPELLSLCFEPQASWGGTWQRNRSPAAFLPGSGPTLPASFPPRSVLTSPPAQARTPYQPSVTPAKSFHPPFGIQPPAERGLRPAGRKRPWARLTDEVEVWGTPGLLLAHPAALCSLSPVTPSLRRPWVCLWVCQLHWAFTVSVSLACRL